MTLSRLAPLLMAALAGCGGSKNAPVDGGPPLALDVWPPDGPGAQLGLAYGVVDKLQVRYHTADNASKPVVGAVVHYSIFMDPAGSTLSSDHAVTDSNGVATVALTAGQAEASFVVAATATNAAEVDFGVTVSKLPFVELDVALAWSDAAANPSGTTLRAQLFTSASCAELVPDLPSLPMSLRSLTQAGTNATTLKFIKLASENYAVLGSALDKVTGQLLGYACVDVGAGLIPSGTTSTLPLTLTPAVATPLGSYTLTSALTPTAARIQAVLPPWQPLGCTENVAQLVLDAMEATSPTLMTELEAHRAPAATDGCRPTTSALDGPLQTLLTTPSVNVKDPPALHFGDIYADLQSILAGAALTSTLTVTPAGASSFTAEHSLSTLTLTVNAHSQSYDLVQLGAPIIDVANIPVGYDGTTLTLGEHGFTLDWPSLWLQGLSDLSIGVRVSALQMTTAPLSPTVAQLIDATFAAAVRNGKSDCVAVSDLVCSIVGGACDVTAACTTAKSALVSNLTETLAPDSGIDLELTSGSASVVAGSDLSLATLSGVWSSPSLAAGTFTGKRN